MATAATVLPACSSGGGGDNGSSNPRDEVTAGGLNFTYPFDGQLDVLLDTQMIVNFPGDLGDVDTNALTLQDTDGNDIDPEITTDQDDTQGNILRLDRDGKSLQSNTDYQVVANADIGAGNTQFSKGDVLFTFRTRPLEGRPADGDFAVTSLSPGEENDLKPESSSKFTQFSAIRVVLNEPVDASTVNDDSFKVIGPDGNQITAGNGNVRLTALGRYIVFDPVKDFEPGDYTIEWTDAITSVFGNSLVKGNKSRTILDAGASVDQTLVIDANATSTDIENLPDDPVGGGKANNVNISSQLIGSNDQPVIGPDDVTFGQHHISDRLATTLAEPGRPEFDDVIPAVIRGGQKFQLKKLKLSLGGGVQTPVISGPIDVNFINNTDVYLKANDYRNIEGPTAVRLRFDLGIGTLINSSAELPDRIRQKLSNSVFNQSVLNIQAAGLAVPKENGDLEINVVGSFPISVNRDGGATVQLSMSLLLPNGKADAPEDDTTPPFVTAVYPSACLYVFGSDVYDDIYDAKQVAPTSLPENVCVNEAGAIVNSFPVEASPAVTFSKPLDPATVNGKSVTLTANNSGEIIDATYRVEGTSVVIDPDEPLTRNSSYSISLNTEAMLKDLVGNRVTEEYNGVPLPMTFRTETISDAANDPKLPGPFLGTLSPGIPCALDDSGNFRNGGDTAGNCTGGELDDDNPAFPVFTNPANVAVNAFFSKRVDVSTIKLADGCIADRNGPTDGNTVDEASIAIQKMDGGGRCVGTVPGDIALGNPGDIATRSFTFRPAAYFKPGERYWIVICGSSGNASCRGKIADLEGQPLNTDPLNGTGPKGDDGQALIMPFTATKSTRDIYTTAQTLPATDINGNGKVDGEGDEGDSKNPEPTQAANRTLAKISLAGSEVDGSAERDLHDNYLSLARPIAIRALRRDEACEAVNNVAHKGGAPAVGPDTPDACIPVDLLPGGMTGLTSIGDLPLGAATGRILLRFPYRDATEADAIDDEKARKRVAQTGYIVEQCTGTLHRPKGVSDVEYNYKPCFVASLNLTANAPDAKVISVDQQQLKVNVVGPVTFQQNGRLVISLRNITEISLDADAPLGLSTSTRIASGDLTFQLATSPIHGGREFPSR